MDLHPTFTTTSATYFMRRSTNDGCRTSKTMIWWELSTIWTRCVVASSLSSSLPIQPPQILDTLDPSSSTFRRCLRELRHICGTRTILPTSYTFSSQRLGIGHRPVASGGSGDVYEGTLDGSKVCVKRVRVYSRDGQTKSTKVRVPSFSQSIVADETRRPSTKRPWCGNA